MENVEENGGKGKEENEKNWKQMIKERSKMRNVRGKRTENKLRTIFILAFHF